MGGKSGGGYDAGPMLEYGQKALDLQERMYDEGVERTQPYYDVGTGGLQMLADLIGISGGSKQSRQQIYDGLKDQYTTTTGSAGSMLVGPDGKVYDYTQPEFAGSFMAPGGGYNAGLSQNLRELAEAGDSEGLKKLGWNMMGGGQTSSTDYDGLNAAVDARLAEQGTPDNFGTLLESFDLDKFQADPGYQFRMDEGQKAIERAAAARGQLYDPSTVKALTDYSSNMADQTYGDAYNRYNNDQNSIFNRLAAISGIGQTANSQLVQSGQNYANQAGNIYGNMGSAVMEANAANAAAPSMFDTLLGAGVQLGGAYLGNPMAFI